MYEDEWRACQEPQKMLDFLRDSGKLSQRKGRLFGVAACRRIVHLMSDERSQRAVEVAELLADGRADEATRSATRRRASMAANAAAETSRKFGHQARTAIASWRAAGAAAYALNGLFPAERELAEWASGAVGGTIGTTGGAEEAVEMAQERRNQADLLRDLFGPLPFRPVAIPVTILTWNSTCIVQMATGIYDERDFSPVRLGVLADALTDAGCTDADLLEHLRRPGLHVRGCWVIDLLIGRQ